MGHAPARDPSSGENNPSGLPLVGVTNRLVSLKVGETAYDREKGGVFEAPQSSPASPAPLDTVNGEATPLEPDAQFVVWWEEPEDQDPANPMNWPRYIKWINIITISVISFVV